MEAQSIKGSVLGREQSRKWSRGKQRDRQVCLDLQGQGTGPSALQGNFTHSEMKGKDR